MRVSVIIPAYKAAKTICRAVDSVLRQSRPAHEIIVVDDGSPDELAAVVEQQYGSQVTLVRQPNARTARARNAGIEQASGDVIAFLDADDYWEPEKLEQQLTVLEQHPQVALVAGRWFDEQPGEPRVEHPLRLSGGLAYDQVLRVTGRLAFHVASAIWTGTVMIRRAALDSQPFVSGLEPAEDRDLWIRIVQSNAVYLLSEPLATAVHEPGSISRSSIDRDCKSMLKVVERHKQLLGSLSTRAWRSYTFYRWAANDPQPSTALRRLLKAILLWPLPYDSTVGGGSFARTKRLFVLLGKQWSQCSREERV